MKYPCPWDQLLNFPLPKSHHQSEDNKHIFANSLAQHCLSHLLPLSALPRVCSVVGRSVEVTKEKMKPWSTALAPVLQVQHQPLGLLQKATTLEIFPKAPPNSIAQTHFYGRYHNPTVQFSSVTQSCPTLRPHELQHTRPPCPSPTPRVHPNS